MPTTTFSVSASADDAYWDLEDTAAGWPPAGTTSSGSDSSITMNARKLKVGGGRTELSEAFFRFDTSALPNDATVSAATLRLQTISVGITGRNCNVGYYAATNWPITAADWSGADDAGSDAGVFALTVFAAGTQEELALTNVAANINLTGYTGFRLSISGGVPANDEDFLLEFATLDHATLLEPQLLVTYTSASELGTIRVVQSTLRW
jgi:hypothetical protein